jgi:hypothetical protein
VVVARAPSILTPTGGMNANERLNSYSIVDRYAVFIVLKAL